MRMSRLRAPGDAARDEKTSFAREQGGEAKSALGDMSCFEPSEASGFRPS
jgi:hypothetical protein